MNGFIIERLFDLDHITAYVVAFLLIAVFVLLFYSFVYHFREMDAKTLGASQNSRLALMLLSGKLQLWIYNGPRRHYTLMEGDSSFASECNPIEFAKRFERNDSEELRKVVFDIFEGRRKSATVTVRGTKDEDGRYSYYEVTLSIARYGMHGEVVDLLGIQRDITDETRRKENVNALLMRYHTVFNSALVDMIYYDKNGVLCDINDKACRSFGIRDRKSILEDNFLLQNNPMFCNIEFNKLENTRTTSLVDFKDYQDAIYQADRFGLHGKMYYESTINPIRNEQGELEGVYMSGRDITEMVNSFHRQQAGVKKLQQGTDSIKEYIANIDYALSVSGVQLVNYYPHSYTFELINRETHKKLHMSQLRCIRLATLRFRRTVNSALNRMDHLTKRGIVQAIEIEIRDKKGRQIWLLFNMVPMLNDKGEVERYFGTYRDITDMVETEQRLAVETKKAQETEVLKQAFLTNMSYEIRTPLNNIIGYAGLFTSDHEESDEPFFMEQIKHSTNELLLLVNDILYISRLEANMEEYKKETVDFSTRFEGICQNGLSTINQGVKPIIVQPYNKLVVDIDPNHLEKIILRLCNLSCLMTTQGSISISYEYHRGELTIRFDDTGIGFAPEVMPHVFDHFTRNIRGGLIGSGLDLPIVQLLAHQMGGNIEIQSEYAKGTSVWVSIPCTASVIEKKRIEV